MCVTTKGHAVTKDNVQMHFIKVLTSLLAGFARRRIRNSGEGAKGDREFASFEECGILGGSNNVLLVLKASASKDFVEFQWIKQCA
jgi:hypothetical protein